MGTKGQRFPLYEWGFIRRYRTNVNQLYKKTISSEARKMEFKPTLW
jgi:hypothetical protein